MKRKKRSGMISYGILNKVYDRGMARFTWWSWAGFNASTMGRYNHLLILL